MTAAETTGVVGKRWLDKWQVKFMVWALVAAAGLLISGATWVVKGAVANEVTDARQDEKIQALERNQAEILKTVGETRDDVKDLRNDIKDLHR